MTQYMFYVVLCRVLKGFLPHPIPRYILEGGEGIKVKFGKMIKTRWTTESFSALFYSHSNHVTSSKEVDIRICLTTMCRNANNFLFIPGHMTL